jgi:hypothetical protein
VFITQKRRREGKSNALTEHNTGGTGPVSERRTGAAALQKGDIFFFEGRRK